jgi:hypothetical protein
VYTGFWWGNLKKTDHIENSGVDGKIIFRWIFTEWGAWIGSVWLMIGKGGRYLKIR